MIVLVYPNLIRLHSETLFGVPSCIVGPFYDNSIFPDQLIDAGIVQDDIPFYVFEYALLAWTQNSVDNRDVERGICDVGNCAGHCVSFME